MDALSIELVSRLTEMSRQLAEMAKEVAGTSADASPPDVAAKMSRNECLYCGKIVDESVEQYRRGLCQAHYQKIHGAIKSRKLSEREAIQLGWWGPASAPGRKSVGPDKLDDYLRSRTTADSIESISFTDESGNVTAVMPKPLQGKELEDHQAALEREDAQRRKLIDDHFRDVNAPEKEPPRKTAKKTDPQQTTRPVTDVRKPGKGKGKK